MQAARVEQASFAERMNKSPCSGVKAGAVIVLADEREQVRALTALGTRLAQALLFFGVVVAEAIRALVFDGENAVIVEFGDKNVIVLMFQSSPKAQSS